MQYFIRINHEEVYVTEEVYKAYCHGQRKERYFRESDIHNNTYSYNALDTDEMNGCDLFPDRQSSTVEEQVQKHMETTALSRALQALEPEERDLIRRIYGYDQSLRQVSRESHIPLSTLHYRVGSILKKLRGLIGDTV